MENENTLASSITNLIVNPNPDICIANYIASFIFKNHGLVVQWRRVETLK